MEDRPPSIAVPPFVAGARLTVSVYVEFCGSYASLIENVYQLVDSSKENASRLEPSLLGEGTPANHDLQSPAPGVGPISPAEVRSGFIIGAAISVGSRDFAPMDTTSPAAPDLPTSDVNDTSSILHKGDPSLISLGNPPPPTTSATITNPPDVPSPFEPRTFPATPVPCQGTLDSVVAGSSKMRSPTLGPACLNSPEPTELLHRKTCPLESAHAVRQAGGLTKPGPCEESNLPTVGGPVVEGPVNPPAEEFVHPPVERLVHPISEVLIATTAFPRPTYHTTTRRFSLSLFQRPTLLDTLVQRLRTKRVLVHSWRIADQFSEWRDTPPARYRLKDLDSSQIYQYLKSGGKSVNALHQPAKEKVSASLPFV